LETKLTYCPIKYGNTRCKLGDRDGKSIIFTSSKLLCINILTITTKTTKCPRGEIGRHKGLKTPGIRKF
tara:strand:+ start:609 stop:815 length:207 start_codon:yes stop_codon:yes gene_type:complete